MASCDTGAAGVALYMAGGCSKASAPQSFNIDSVETCGFAFHGMDEACAFRVPPCSYRSAYHCLGQTKGI